jgi:hypothetical protein
MKTIVILKKIIFFLSIAFIVISLLELTIAQSIPIEFADPRVRYIFYNCTFYGFPIAILLTLFGTIKKENTRSTTWTTGVLTIAISFVSIFIIVISSVRIGFGAWRTEYILFRHEGDKNHTISEQIWYAKSSGYGAKRTVELRPFLKCWNKVISIDTAKIDKHGWIFVNEIAD